MFQPELPLNATADDIAREIAFINALKDNHDRSIDPSGYADDMAMYDAALEDLFRRLDNARREAASGSNGEGSVHLTLQHSPGGNSSGSSALSRKRSFASMGDFDLSNPKRASLNPSPAVTPSTPSTPASLNILEEYASGTYLEGPSNGSHKTIGRIQGSQSVKTPQFYSASRDMSSMPIRPHQPGGNIFQQQQFGGAQIGAAGPSNQQLLPPLNNFIDLTASNDGPLIDPFPEVAFAYRDNSYPTPADAFSQDFMGGEELVEYLLTPTQPGGGYALNGGQQGAGPQPNFPLMPTVPTLIGPDPPDMKHDQTSLAEELFGDFEMPGSGLEVQSEAVSRLIENIKPDDELPPEQREQTPPAMQSQLMEHQKIGLTWLKKMEQGTMKGGILADEMGLGKTVQALALILANPSTDPACKTTLIIAPIALMRQWEKELQRHVKPSHQLKVYVYHGHGKNADFSKLRKYDVVLTTFGTLGSEMKQMEQRKEAELVQREQREPAFVRKAKDKLALIGQECLWYRIIIDEAQCIKNKATLVSKASNELMARYRLCMTGTPMMNSIDELFPLIRFLRIKPYNDWGRFNDSFSKPFKQSKTDWRSKQILGRLQAFIKSIMLRREKTSIVDGKEICTIPPKVTKLQSVEFSDEERDLYIAIETSSQVKMNRYLERGTVNNNYANVLVLLLRLRQACCHPHLIKDLGVQVSTEGIAEDDLLRRAQQLNKDVINRLKEADGFECPICLEADLNPTIIIPCGHTCCGECFQKLIDPTNAIREGNEDNSGAKCPHCRGPLSINKITDYKHFCKMFCPERLEESERLEEQVEDKASDSDSDSDEEDMDDVNEAGDLEGFVVPDDADDSYEGPSPRDEANQDKPKSAKSKSKDKGKAPAKPKVTLAQLKKESLRNKAAKRKYLRRLRKTYVSSGKLEKTVELLQSIHANDPTEKTLIFSQFTSLLDLLEVPLSDQNFKYQRYDGSMRLDNRAEAVNKFMDEADEKIMLISLKAGNAGLNLNKASQVIILDPFWNPFIEDQAVDRAHRMPQERKVHVHRLLVPETVEDRICALQDKKREIINAALDEKAGKSLSRLTVRELLYLFNMAPPPDRN